VYFFHRINLLWLFLRLLACGGYVHILIRPRDLLDFVSWLGGRLRGNLFNPHLGLDDLLIKVVNLERDLRFEEGHILLKSALGVSWEIL
jgi:hypothetical protein